MNRHFYRCLGCLEVLALDGGRLPMNYSATVAECDNCGEHFEWMGKVEVDRLIKEELRCKCDDRCTSARGPRCTCKCGAENHGAGMLGYVRVAIDAGAVPRIAPPSATRATQAKRNFEQYKALRAVALAELDALLTKKNAPRGWLESREYDRMRELQNANRRGNEARTHAARMKAMQAVVKMPASNPVAAVADAVTEAIQTAGPLAEVPFSLTPQAATRRGTQTTLF